MSGNYTLVTSSLTIESGDTDAVFTSGLVSAPEGMIAISAGFTNGATPEDGDPAQTQFVPSYSFPKYGGAGWFFGFNRIGPVPTQDCTINLYVWCDDAPESMDLAALREQMRRDTAAAG